MQSDAIEKAFPDLVTSGYKISSPRDYRYNCIAWAAKSGTKWWWPDPQNIGFWPAGVPREVSLESFMSAFESLGFSVCDNQDFEDGFEKIAIFTDSQDIPTHAARQLPSGKWTSELGRLEDIEHELIGVGGAAYGKISVVLRKPL
jgi:hypothetical protein